MKDACDGIHLFEIGRIRTSFTQAEGTPIQSRYAEGAEGVIVVEDCFADALDDIAGFERVWLLYFMDRVCSFNPHVVPYRDTRPRGLFATRSPCRPNPIGMSVVRLLGREGARLRVADVDMLDDTPLLDIHPSARAGWFEESRVDRRVADGRFHAQADSKRGGHR